MALRVALAAGALAAAGSATADTAGIQRCRIIAEAPARLACYDAIALPGLGSRAGWGAPAAGAAPAAAAPATTATGTAAATAAATGFGMERRAAEAAPDRMESRINGRVDEFNAGTRYRLDNGQVWQITETASGFYSLDNPKVVVTRGALGNFLMSIDGVNVALRVRRIQ
jgi:hypothetical protein